MSTSSSDTPSGHPPAICTIVARNYLAHARTLARSFKVQHPDGQVFVLLVDRCAGLVNPAEEPFVLIEGEQIGIRRFQDMAIRYSVLEFATAVKPFFLEYLMDHYDLDTLAYFDPDIVIYAPITPILDALQTAHVALTPHLLRPLSDGHRPTDLEILRAGVYNLGFIALRREQDHQPGGPADSAIGPLKTGDDLWLASQHKVSKHLPQWRALLRWWQRKLEKECVAAPERGLFVDQRWADLIPAFIEHTAILRHPGLNMAYWNLAQRHLIQQDSGWQVSEPHNPSISQPLIFYHFSGFNLANMESISRFQDRYTLSTRPELRPLFEDYANRLLANGYEQVRSIPYVFGHFENGVPIPDVARQMWSNLPGEPIERWPQPFAIQQNEPAGQAGESREDVDFYTWLNAPAVPDVQNGLRLTNLAMAIYKARKDVQGVYPQVLDRNRLGYLLWFVSDGISQHKLDRSFATPVEASLPSQPGHFVQMAFSGQALAPLLESSALPRTQRSRRMLSALPDFLRKLGLLRLARQLIGDRRVDAIAKRYYAVLKRSNHQAS